MKKSIMLLAVAVFLMGGVPAFADSAGTSVINHNDVSGQYFIGKKISNTKKQTTSISLGVKKTILVNAFGDEFDPVPLNKGWGGVLEMRTLFE